MEWIKWNILSSDAMSSSQQPSQPQQTSATVLSGAAASQLIARLREAQQNGGGGNVHFSGEANAGTIKIQVSYQVSKKRCLSHNLSTNFSSAPHLFEP